MVRVAMIFMWLESYFASLAIFRFVCASWKVIWFHDC